MAGQHGEHAREHAEAAGEPAPRAARPRGEGAHAAAVDAAEGQEVGADWVAYGSLYNALCPVCWWCKCGCYAMLAGQCVAHALYYALLWALCCAEEAKFGRVVRIHPFLPAAACHVPVHFLCPISSMISWCDCHFSDAKVWSQPAHALMRLLLAPLRGCECPSAHTPAC